MDQRGRTVKIWVLAIRFQGRDVTGLLTATGPLTFGVIANASGDIFSYAAVLQMRWHVFLLWIGLLFILINAGFGMGFLMLGPTSLALNGPDPGVGHVWRSLFFSVHTFTTIGYGNVVPVGFRSNALVVGESFVGFLMYSLATGLLFAAFHQGGCQNSIQCGVCHTNRGEASSTDTSD